jgi:hypothetical protein
MRDVDREVQARIERGNLIINPETLEVSYYHRNNDRWYTKKPNQHPKSGRWRFQFAIGDKRNNIYRNRLVWMYFNGPVPDGYVVDHIDGDNQNDYPGNLQLMEIGTSHQQGNGVQADKVLDELSWWFDMVGYWGYEPVGE